MGGGDKAAVEQGQGVAGHLRHGGGRRLRLRQGGVQASRRVRATQFPEPARPAPIGYRRPGPPGMLENCRGC
ncbi:ethylene-responsive transcription factor erf061 [Phtheirospermum japonicum]|uniref:Ethylene-responsive transcription factor erf061 n=1 Tax=Phtheirospermum japonicum TaxID=374723 RepID=A0A830BKS1_9LAMI|nr:ethylene-responsive transcription factor erf061 [Phtheirospermum japonicum]